MCWSWEPCVSKVLPQCCGCVWALAAGMSEQSVRVCGGTGGALWTSRAGHAPGDSKHAWISSNVTCFGVAVVTSLGQPEQELRDIHCAPVQKGPTSMLIFLKRYIMLNLPFFHISLLFPHQKHFWFQSILKPLTIINISFYCSINDRKAKYF